MKKFKVGDRVKVVCSCCSTTFKDKEIVIHSVNNNGKLFTIQINIDGHKTKHQGYNPHDLKLIPTIHIPEELFRI